MGYASRCFLALLVGGGGYLYLHSNTLVDSHQSFYSLNDFKGMVRNGPHTNSSVSKMECCSFKIRVLERASLLSAKQ